MKNTYSLFYMLLMLVLASCSSQNFTSFNQVEDDTYWSEKDDARSPGENINSVEPWRNEKNNGTKPAPSRYNEEPENNAANETYEDERGKRARQNWENQRFNEGNQTQRADENFNESENFNQENFDSRQEERDARRFGSNRNFYYDDPYFQALSPSWGWTSLFNPVVRPGFYNWAPGWNVGLSFNSFNGFGVGMGMQYGYGFGYNPFFYDPWMMGVGGFGMGFHNPWHMNMYNPYSPWGFNPWYNPYRFGFGCGGFYNPWDFRNQHHFGGGGGDIVTNRPLMQPRNSMGSSIPSSVGTNRPNNQNFDGKSIRDNRPNQGVNANGVNPALRPDRNIRYTPNRPPVGTQTPGTNRPGGDLAPDQNGRPTYVSPNNNPSRGADQSLPNSNRPGGELRDGRDGRPVYVPPSRGRNDGNEGRPSFNNDRPSRSYDGGNTNPSRNPGNSAPSTNRPTYDSPRNRGNSGSYSPPPQQSAPSRPSYSAPSRPAPSAPSGPSRSEPSRPAGGGGMRPR